jgi:hypothetical protein
MTVEPQIGVFGRVARWGRSDPFRVCEVTPGKRDGRGRSARRQTTAIVKFIPALNNFGAGMDSTAISDDSVLRA